MPNYDFNCEACGHKFSRMVAIEERKNVKCPQCESTDVKQLFTGFSVLNKGGNTTSLNSCSTGG